MRTSWTFMNQFPLARGVGFRLNFPEYFKKDR